MELYLVGGAVRDEIMGVKPKDFDYTFVSTLNPKVFIIDDYFQHMVDTLKDLGYTIFLESPQFFTVRAKFPGWHENSGQTADFVLAREEGPYSDSRRPDWVKPGTIEMDLARRDFSMNAIGKDRHGNLIDPHNGVRDIERRIIKAVGDPLERLSEDPLRALRAIRFMVTKDFRLDMNLANALAEPAIHEGVANSVADERIGDELGKMFRHNTVASIIALNMFPGLMAAAFSGNVSLDSTLKTKGREGKTVPPRNGQSDKPAYHGCECLCHKEKGVMHMSACCRP